MTRAMPENAAGCRVPGCQRWSRKYTNFICGTHWRRLTKAERRVWGRLNRLGKKLEWQLSPKLARRFDRIWYGLIRRAGL